MRNSGSNRRPASEHVEVDEVALPSFALSDELGAFDSEWHQHRFHQLLYAAEGTMRLVTKEASWVLPPRRAAWIPSETEHRVQSDRGISLRTVYVEPGLVRPEPARKIQVFDVTPLARELIAEAMRFGPRSERGPLADPLFETLVTLCAELSVTQLSVQLPAARTPELLHVMERIQERLREPLTLSMIANDVGASVRTLERRFQEETGGGFRDFLRLARMRRALELLSEPSARIKNVAFAVGFSSEAAFTRAFSEIVGERPTDFQRRSRGS